MQRQIEKVFGWVEEKSGEEDVCLLMHPDLSGSIVDAWHLDNILFSFADIMEVTKEDIDNFDLEKWLYKK